MKSKLEKARLAMEGLPDICMTIEEQEEEIHQLEEEIRGLERLRREIAGARKKSSS